jgi:hypothetical protein
MKVASAVLCLTSIAIAQPSSQFDIHSCTNYTSRGLLGPNSGENLLMVPSSHFGGVGQDSGGTGTRFLGFMHVTQDQNATTSETYFMVIRADNSGAPDCSATPGRLVYAGPLSTPSSTVTTPVAWLISASLATPSTALPLCSTFYMGAEISAAPAWPNDGQSFHIGTYYMLGGTQGDNPAPNAPNLAWDCLTGSATQPGSARCIRISLCAPSAMLKLGNHDATLTNPSNCVVTQGNVSFGAGGMWPQAQGTGGPRNDGLDFRVRDTANPNGTTIVFLGQNIGCPGVPLAGVANGALYLNPGGIFVQLAAAAVDANGQAIGRLISGSPAVAVAVNRILDFQAFVIGPTFALPGNLTNRASVAYLP